MQTITAASSKLQIQLPTLSKPGFVEVLSEQGLGLLYFDLQQEALDVPAPRVAAVDLSDGRQLSVSLTLAGGAPVIDVFYYDPLLEVGPDEPSAPATVPEPLHPSLREDCPTHVEMSRKRHGWPLQLLSHLQRARPWIIATAIGLGVLITLGHVHAPVPSGVKQPITAARLLAQSMKQTADMVPPHGALHQNFVLEVRSGPGARIGLANVDLLRSADRPLEALRLRTASGRPLAAHCVDRNGKAHDLLSRERSRPGNSYHAMDTWDQAWQFPPDPADFMRLAGTERDLELQEVQNGYEVRFKRPASSATASVVEGRLVIATNVMRPIAETLVVQRGEEIRRYQFKELRYEVFGPEQLKAGDFLPDPQDYEVRRNADETNSVLLTLQTLQVLDKRPEDVQAAVDVMRRPGEGVEVAGVLKTDQQKRSLIQALRALDDGASLKLDLHSADAPRTHHAATVELAPPSTVMADRIPLDSMLARSVAAQSGLTGAALDAQVRQAAREVVARGARVHRAAWVFRQISARDFRDSELAAMSTQQKQLWLALLVPPLKVCEVETDAIRSRLTGDVIAVLPQERETRPIGTVRDLAREAAALQQNAGDLDRLLVSGFAVPLDNSSIQVSPADLLGQLSTVQHEVSGLARTVQRLQQGKNIAR